MGHFELSVLGHRLINARPSFYPSQSALWYFQVRGPVLGRGGWQIWRQRAAFHTATVFLYSGGGFHEFLRTLHDFGVAEVYDPRRFYEDLGFTLYGRVYS